MIIEHDQIISALEVSEGHVLRLGDAAVKVTKVYSYNNKDIGFVIGTGRDETFVGTFRPADPVTVVSDLR